MVNKMSLCRTCRFHFKYRTPNSKGIYCSIKCRNDDPNYVNPMKGKSRPDLTEYNRREKPKCTGSNNPNWKGGITSKIRRLRSSGFYRVWRNNILDRDKHQCRFCLSKNKLEVHHIVPVFEFIKDYPKAAFEEENGITLCHSCHSRIDKSRCAPHE